MKVKLIDIELTRQEADRAKNYWATPGTQPLTHKRPSHYARALAEIVQQVEAESIFEFGCAAGRNLDAIAKSSERKLILAGCDVNANSISQGKSTYGFDLRVGDENSLAEYKSNSFDLSFTVSVLDHLPEPEAAIKRLMRMTRKAMLFIEPHLPEKIGKISEIKTEWSSQKSAGATPFTYFHDYLVLFEELGLRMQADVPLPTHVNRVGPFYKLFIVTKATRSSARVIDWKRICENASAASTLQLIKEVELVNEETKLQKKSLHDKDKLLRDKEEQLNNLEQNLLSKEAEFKRGVEALNESLSTKERQFTERRQSLESQLKISKEKVQVSVKRVKKLRNSTKYKIGKAIVSVAAFPLQIVGLKKSKVSKPALLPQPDVGLATTKLSKHEKNYVLLEKLIPPRLAYLRPESRRIAYILHNSLPFATGGYATRTHGVATGLVSNGYEVTGITRPGFPLDIGVSAEFVARSGRARIDEVDYVTILEPKRTGTPLYDYVVASAEVLEKKIAELQPSAVMSASFAEWSGLPALIAARRLALPFFYEVRGFNEVTRESRDKDFTGTDRHSFLVKIENLVCNQADHVFTLTGPMKREICERGVDPGKITLAPNSCDANRFTPRERDLGLANQLGISGSTVVIGYVGTFVDYEGLEDLVVAAAELRERKRDFRVLLVGGENVTGHSEGPVTKLIREKIAKNGLQGQVILPGRVPHHEVERFYSLVDIAVFPRKPWKVCEMVSPMKPMEAMSMEKAVVVSNVVALAEMVKHGETGMHFQKGDIFSLANVLDALICDAPLRRTLGGNARRWVVAERTWKTTTSAMIREFEISNASAADLPENQLV